MQKLLRREGGEEGRSVDCCPSVMEMVQPKGGRNQEGLYVELYVGNNPYNETQRFYEFSCREDVLDRPCRFVDRKLRNQSRCEQKYAYQYAIVRNDSGAKDAASFFPNGTSGWKLDYILVRSGCSCVVMPKTHSRKGKAAQGGRDGSGASGAARRYKGHNSRERGSPSSDPASSPASSRPLDALPRIDPLDDEDNT